MPGAETTRRPRTQTVAASQGIITDLTAGLSDAGKLGLKWIRRSRVIQNELATGSGSASKIARSCFICAEVGWPLRTRMRPARTSIQSMATLSMNSAMAL